MEIILYYVHCAYCKYTKTTIEGKGDPTIDPPP